MKQLLTPKQASEHFGVHVNTLRTWDRQGYVETVRTKGGDRRYVISVPIQTRTVCYCRVSSYKQKADLQRQKQFMREKYPDAEIITDIGSGLNFKRKGLKAVLEYSMSGGVQTVVVAHKDRLCRFGFELVRWIIEKNGGKLVVLSKDECSPEQELTRDLLSILHVFSCRLHGLRSYKNKINKALSDKRTKESA